MGLPEDSRIIERFIVDEGWPLPAYGLEHLLIGPTTKIDLDVGPLRVYRCGFGRFGLSERDHVYEYEAPAFETAPAPLPADDARLVAHDFCARHVAAFDARFALEEMKASATTRMFHYVQVRQPHELSIYVNDVFVYVDLTTHKVRRFVCTDLDFVRVTPTALDAAAAKQRLLAITDGRAVDDLTLSEVPIDERRRSISAWSGQVLKEGGPSGMLRTFAWIDADTGAALPKEL